MSMGESHWPEVRFAVIREAWQLYKRHFGVWSVATLLVLIGYALVGGLVFKGLGAGELHGPGGLGPLLFIGQHFVPSVLANTVSLFLLGGMIRMASNQLRGRRPRIEDLFSITDVWFDLLLVAFLYGLGTFAGLAACLIPGLILAGLWMLAIPLVVEGGLPATGALIQSWHSLKSQWLVIAVFHSLLVLLCFSGIILCGIGILCTGPLYALSVAILYRSFFPVPPSTASKPKVEPFPEI
jgi:hypothetical protein